MKKPEKKPTIIDDLKQRCEQAGTNLTALCAQARVNRSILERWKTHEPKSFQILNRLNVALEKIERETKTMKA